MCDALCLWFARLFAVSTKWGSLPAAGRRAPKKKLTHQAAKSTQEEKHSWNK